MAAVRNGLENIIEVDGNDEVTVNKDRLGSDFCDYLLKRVCTRFVPNTLTILANDETYCCCGRKMGYHETAAFEKHQALDRSTWRVETDTKLTKTDACGMYTASMSGGKCSTRYLRLDYATDMHMLRTYLRHEWQMGPVQFLVTLIGSTSTVYLRKKTRSSVQRALVRLLETCGELGGWLLASGAGMTQQMSAALDEQLQLEQEVLHLIAIQPWGTLRHDVRKTLVDDSQHYAEGLAPLEHNDRNSGSGRDETDDFPTGQRMHARRGTSPNILDCATSETDNEMTRALTSSSPNAAESPATSSETAATSPRQSAASTSTASPLQRTSSILSRKSKKLIGSMSKRTWIDTSEVNQLHQLPLNHPYVLLVDSGQLGSSAFGAENCFRQRLEVELSRRHKHNSAAKHKKRAERVTPACYVLFGGGPRSTRQVQYALSRNIPVVVLQGTGKMADILALACTKADEEDLDPLFVLQNGLPDRLRVYFRQAIKERVEVKDENTLNEILIDVEKCMAYHHLISVYPIDSAKCDLDTRVLRAMLCNVERPRLLVDEAQILRYKPDSLSIEPEICMTETLRIDVEELLCNALLHNHLDCVHLVLARTELNLHKFLTVDRLSTLYMPDNLKGSTFKSLLLDRRLRDSRWFNAKLVGPSCVSPQDADQHHHVGVAPGDWDSDEYLPGDQIPMQLMQRPLAESSNAQEFGEFAFCPLTLAGKVITRMLGSYFHSSFLYSGHHLELHPQSVLAVGQFQTALRRAESTVRHAHSSVHKDSIDNAKPAAGLQRGHLFEKPASPADQLDDVRRTADEMDLVVVSNRKPLHAAQPTRRRKRTTFSRHALINPERTSFQCSGDHSEAAMQSVSGDVTDAPLEETRMIAQRFQFIRNDQCAALHLFVWCVLQMRIELSMLFWKRTHHKMAAAFVARLILRGLLKAEKSVEMKERIRLEIDKFESLALGVLNLAYDNDVHRTEYLLLAKLDDVAEMSTMQLAARADCKNFIAHPACTSLLDAIWCGGLSPRNAWWRILLCILLPVFIPFLIVFHSRPSLHSATQPRRDVTDSSTPSKAQAFDKLADTEDVHFTFFKRMKTTAKAKRRARLNDVPQQHDTVTDSGTQTDDHQFGCLCCEPYCQFCGKVFNCIFKFYTAPKTIFAMNTIFYISFLLLFSYVMLFAFNPRSFNIPEWLVAICMVGLTCEELRQFFLDEAGGFRSRFHMYFSSVWNILDFASLTCFYVGFIAAMRPFGWCDICMEFGRILVSVSLLILYLRLLNIFSVNQELGPKLVMLGQMIKNVFGIFIMIGIFVMAYGVAAQSIMYPNVGQHDVISVIRNATMRGYFAMFGDLRLEEIDSATPCESLQNATGFFSNYFTSFSMLLGMGNFSQKDSATSSSSIDDNQLRYCSNELAKYTVPVLLAIHVVMTNLVLFNVLIAIFNFIFNKIDDQTDEHWRYNMYCLIEEYRAKPPFTPPLVLIWHFFLFLYLVVDALPCCNCIKSSDWFTVVRRRFTVAPFCCEQVCNSIREELSRFEHQTASRYVKELEETKRSETDARLSLIDAAVKEANTLLAAVHNVVIATDYNTELLKKRDRQQSGLEKVEMFRTRNEMQKMIHDALDSRMKPVEEKLNLLLTSLSELKSSAQK